MSDEEYKRILSKNLMKQLEKSGKTQKEVADHIGVGVTTFNNWCVGVALPRMGKVQMLADYFGIEKSDLIEEKADKHYYIDDEAREMAEFMFENPEYRVLFDASRKVKKEDIEFVRQMIDRMTNND